MAVKRHLKPKFKLQQVGLMAVVLLMVLFSVYSANQAVKKVQRLAAEATLSSAQVFFNPANLTINPSGNVSLWVTTNNTLAFAQVEVIFDQTKLRLNREVELTTSPLTKVIQVSSMAQANNTGKISLAMAVEPANLATAQVNSLKLADLNFSANTSLLNQTASLTIVASNTQLVDKSASLFVTTTSASLVTVNPVTPTITVAPTTLPSLTPVPTLTNQPARPAAPTVTQILILTSVSVDGNPIVTPTPAKNPDAWWRRWSRYFSNRIGPKR